MQKKRCIVVAVSSLAGGGAERVAIQLANNCQLPGLDVVLLVASDEGQYREIIHKAVNLITVDIPLATSRSVHFASRLRALLKQWDPVVVISHLTEMNRMLLRCKAMGALKAPIAVVDHNSMALKSKGVGGLRGQLLRWEYAYLYKKAFAVVGVSQGVLDSVQSITGTTCERGRVINNSIDVSSVQKAASTKPDDDFAHELLSLPRPLVLSVGRLNWQKAYHDLIHAFAALPCDSRGSLVILGEGELLGELQELAGQIGLQNSVYFPGFLKNPWWFMAQCDLFVSSSVWEGFGLVLAEAMACGVPVVSTESPGPVEVIEHGVSGLLVPAGDVKALSLEMNRCLTDESLRQSLIAGGLVRVTRFLPETTYSGYVELINDAQKGGE